MLSATRNIKGMERRVVATVVRLGEDNTPRYLGRQSEPTGVRGDQLQEAAAKLTVCSVTVGLPRQGNSRK